MKYFRQSMIICWLFYSFAHLQLAHGQAASSIVNYGSSSLFNTSFGANTRSIICNGRGSCAFSTITSIGPNPGWTLGGARSSQSCIMYDATIKSTIARGYLSLAWSKSIVTSNSHSDCFTKAFGEASMFGVKYLNNPNCYMLCYGTLSCANMETVENIRDYVSVFGMFGAVNSNFYTSGTGRSVDFNMEGYYSGYNASIYCLDGDTCSIWCHANACNNLKFDCDTSSSTCNVDCDETTNVSCPIGWGGTDVIDDIEDVLDLVDYVLEGDDIGEMKRLWSMPYEERGLGKEECDGIIYDGQSFNCQDYQECNNIVISNPENTNPLYDKPICCTADDSCPNSIDLTLSSGETNVSIYLDAHATMGTGSIKMSSGPNDNIYARSNSAIGDGSHIENFNKFIITTVQGTMDIINGNYIGCFGQEACSSSNISGVSYIFGTATSALSNSFIYSGGKDINVFLAGRDVASNLNIICDRTFECNIHCLDEISCESLQIAHTPPTSNPTSYPTVETLNPSKLPTLYPTIETVNPSEYPTTYPTSQTSNPTEYPTSYPTILPTIFPSIYPTAYPIAYPTLIPTSEPVFSQSETATTTDEQQKQPTRSSDDSTTDSDIDSIASAGSKSDSDDGDVWPYVLAAVVCCLCVSLILFYVWYKKRAQFKKDAQVGELGETAKADDLEMTTRTAASLATPALPASLTSGNTRYAPVTPNDNLDNSDVLRSTLSPHAIGEGGHSNAGEGVLTHANTDHEDDELLYESNDVNNANDEQYTKGQLVTDNGDPMGHAIGMDDGLSANGNIDDAIQYANIDSGETASPAGETGTTQGENMRQKSQESVGREFASPGTPKTPKGLSDDEGATLA